VSYGRGTWARPWCVDYGHGALEGAVRLWFAGVAMVHSRQLYDPGARAFERPIRPLRGSGWGAQWPPLAGTTAMLPRPRTTATPTHRSRTALTPAYTRAFRARRRQAASVLAARMQALFSACAARRARPCSHRALSSASSTTSRQSATVNGRRMSKGCRGQST
jgi:hypothetical protein